MKTNISREKLIDGFVSQMMIDRGIFDEKEKKRLIFELDRQIDKAIIRKLPAEKLRKLREEFSRDEISQDEVNEAVFGGGLRLDRIVLAVLGEFRAAYMEGR